MGSGIDDIDPTSSASALASAGIDGSSATVETAPIDPTGADTAIAEALATGRVDAAEAQELLLTEVLAEHLPNASPETVERMAEEMRALVADDPTLTRLLAVV